MCFVSYVGLYGLPRSLYVDQHSIYRADREPTGDEILQDVRPETQFGRAMRELDVELILARSAASEGSCGTDERHVARPAGEGVASRRDIGPCVGERVSGEDVFAGVERVSSDGVAGGRLASRVGVGDGLVADLSVQEPRVVQNDWTVRWRNQIMQLASESAAVVQPKQRVTLCEQLDGRVAGVRGRRGSELVRQTAFCIARPSKPARGSSDWFEPGSEAACGSSLATAFGRRREGPGSPRRHGAVGLGLLRYGSLALASATQAKPTGHYCTPKPMGHF